MSSRRSRKRCVRTVLGAAAVAAAVAVTVDRAPASTTTVTVVDTAVGSTPRVFGYNMGHYLPGGNTSAWLQYSGANAFRYWGPANDFESSDDAAPFGDGVTSLSAFDARKAALRVNPESSTYINWAYFNNNFANHVLAGRNKATFDYPMSQLQKMGIDTLLQSTRGGSAYPISDWGGKWEQWQFYYVMAYYSAKNYDTQRFQMYNEPDIASIAESEWLDRLHLASDAVQSAIADVNRLYGKKLTADVYAPVAASTTGSFSTWGKDALNQNRTGYDGNPQPNDVFNTYDVHRYNSLGSSFAADQTFFDSNIPAQNAAGQNMPVTYSEFNRYTSSNFASRSDSLDTSANFTELGNIVVGAMTQDVKGMYAFKFNQTAWTPSGSSTVQPQKTGFYYVDDSSLNTTGATQGAEVMRLAMKAFKGERPRLATGLNAGNGNYDYASSLDAGKQNYYYFSVNRNAVAAGNQYDVTVNMSGWKIAPGQVIAVEEVSDASHGQVTQYLTVPSNKVLTFSQPAQSVWLLTTPAGTAVQTKVDLSATADAQVSNASPTTNYGLLGTAKVDRSNTTTSDDAAYMKFNLGSNSKARVARAYLNVTGSNSADTAPAYVYGILNDNWTETGITWNTAPDLGAAGATDAKLANVGADAFPVGQLSWSTTTQEWGIDVTDFVRKHPDSDLSFVLVREQRFNNSVAVDTDTSRIIVNTREALGGQPRLSLFLSQNPLYYWNQNVGNGSFGAGGNWDAGSAPNAAGAVAVLGDFVTSPKTLPVLAAATVGELRFANVNSYTLSGSSTITLDGGSGAASAINVYQGSHTIDAPVALATSTTVTVNSNLSLAMTKNLSGTGSLNKAGGGTLMLGGASNSVGNVLASGGRLELSAGGNKVLRAPLILVDGGVIDLKNNQMIVTSAGQVGSWNGTSYTNVTGGIQRGRHGGDWAGSGIVTSMAGASDYTTLGVATASNLFGIAATATATWSGQTVHGSDALVAYTYGGDANVDGVIDIDDYTQIDSSVAVGGALKGWFNGDFNYDGLVNVDDYTIIDSNIGVQGPPLAARQVGAAGGSSAVAVTSVPEPAAVAGLTVCGVLVAARRRSRISV